MKVRLPPVGKLEAIRVVRNPVNRDYVWAKHVQ
jgi:hypothetical protein